MTSHPAVIMLASGSSTRFGSANKLLTKFKGIPLAEHTAALGTRFPHVHRLAVVDSSSPPLSTLYLNYGWTTLQNPTPSKGQSSSLRIGVSAAKDLGASSIIVCLADMPFIDDFHLENLSVALRGVDAVMTCSSGALLPPAAFSNELYPQLLGIRGDRGAKIVFEGARRQRTVEICPSKAIDLDTPADFETYEAAYG